MTGWAAEAAVNSTLVTAVITGLLGSGFGATVVALFRVNADRGKIVIETAQGAVIVQTGVMAELRAELNRLKEELVALRAERDTEVDRLRGEVVALREARDAEVAQLRAEVARLRAEGAVTATRVSRVEQAGDGVPGQP